MTREGIEEELRHRIHDGRYRPGQRIPSERRLADELGVNRSIVRAAIQSLAKLGIVVQQPNCRPLVASKAEHGSAERRQDSTNVAVWLQPDLQDPGAAMILQGIRTAIAKSRHRLLVGFPSADPEGDEEGESRFLRSLLARPDVVGVIVWETAASALTNVFPILRGMGIPVVFVDREPPPEIEADVVSTHNRRGALKAVTHLVRLGHRHIAMISNDEPVSSVRDRIEGYRDALRDAEIAYRADLQATLTSEDLLASPEELAERVRRLLRAEPSPTAIFCVNDGIALRVRQALAADGVRVPEDVSLVGFDWLQRSLPLGGDLTTVAQPFEAIGRIAAERILDRIGGDDSPPRLVLLEAPLVVKATTGSAPSPVQREVGTAPSRSIS